MSAITRQISLLTSALLVSGYGIYQLFQELTNAKPENSLWIKLSRYSKYAPWIEAQARHESANYTSEVFKRSNNPFGMKNANIRAQLGRKVAGDPYRHYSSVGEAILDYLMYLRFVNFPTNIGDPMSFVQALKDRKYFGDTISNYQKGVQSWLA